MKIIIIVSVSLFVGILIGGLTEIYQLDSRVNLLIGFVTMIVLLIGGYIIDIYFD